MSVESAARTLGLSLLVFNVKPPSAKQLPQELRERDDYLRPAALDHALELAETAVDLDSRLPQARAQLGDVLLYKRQNSSEP